MDIAAVLTLRYSSSEWILEGDNYETLNWLSNSPKPEEEELEALWPEVQAEIQVRQQAKIDAKDSLRSKLAALGLTEEEIAAL
jgi:hypothetical protein